MAWLRRWHVRSVSSPPFYYVIPVKTGIQGGVCRQVRLRRIMPPQAYPGDPAMSFLRKQESRRCVGDVGNTVGAAHQPPET